MGLGSQRQIPASYPQERYPVPVALEDVWAPGPLVRKLSPVPGLDTWPVQLVANRYTGYAILASFRVENSYSLRESHEAHGAFQNALRDYKYL
jgi:hypothetical protein